MNNQDNIKPGFVYLHESEWAALVEKTGQPTKKGAMEFVVAHFMNSTVTEPNENLKATLEKRTKKKEN